MTASNICGDKSTCQSTETTDAFVQFLYRKLCFGGFFSRGMGENKGGHNPVEWDLQRPHPTCEPECRRSNSLLNFHTRLESFFSPVVLLTLTEAVQFTQKLTLLFYFYFFCSNHEPPIFSPTGSVSVSENGWNSQFSISLNVITHIPHLSIHPSIHHLSALFITCLALVE